MNSDIFICAFSQQVVFVDGNGLFHYRGKPSFSYVLFTVIIIGFSHVLFTTFPGKKVNLSVVKGNRLQCKFNIIPRTHCQWFVAIMMVYCCQMFYQGVKS